MGGKYSSMNPMDIEVPKIDTLLSLDPYLKPYEREIRRRYGCYKDLREIIERDCHGFDAFTQAYKTFGMNVQLDGSILCQEWAPGAKQLYLTGEFNNWNRSSHPYTKQEFGVWKLVLPPKSDGTPAIPHLSELKIVVENNHGEKIDHLSPYATYVVRPDNNSADTTYKHQFWHPPECERYTFKPNDTTHPTRPKSLRIYECHIGIATAEPRIGQYTEFTEKMLARIVHQGYNAIQVMAIMEHAYYASFGYQVTSFYAVSSRYGTPEQLKCLIDKAHDVGLTVLLDLIHSHASKNVADGLNMFDGTEAGFFHAGHRGLHSLWDSRLFNYREVEVLRFLLSNIRWYMEEYRFDGFRFDGITSMLYHSHGIDEGFTGHYDQYFGLNVDTESWVYLMLANELIHSLNPEAITIAEEVSGMPTTCRPVAEGGLGFDYRLAMAIPDKWIQLLKHYPDEEWNVGNLVHTLTNRRWCEPNIAYAECHDQAIVGDKTIAFWLMDSAMYTHMSRMSSPSTVIERGIALHKLIRLLTHSLGGEAYLNFMGNEFGHPEWLDFPRAGNSQSYKYARRQWHLVDDDLLKYSYMNRWDRQMNLCEEKYHWLAAPPAYVSLAHEMDKVIVYERAGLLFIVNLHPSNSFPDYRVGVEAGGVYKIVLCSDLTEFGGHNRVDTNVEHSTMPDGYCNRKNSILVYIPSRSGIVLALI